MNLPAGDSNPAGGESLGDELARVLDLGPSANPANVRPREGDPAPPPDASETEADQDPSLEVPEASEAPLEASDDEQGEEQAEEGQEIRKFTDLTALFDGEEVTAEDLYALEVISGDGESLTVGDLKDHWQNRAAFETEKAEFAKTREQQAKELEELRSQATAQVGEFQQLPQELREAEAAILAIRQQAQAYDWKSAEDEDPGAAALTRQKFRDAYDAAADRYRQLWGEYTTKKQEAYRSFVATQREKMFERIPEWRDDKVLTQDREAIDKTVAAYGFSKAEIDSIVDPRLSQLLRDFMLLKTKFQNAVNNRNEVRNRGQNRVLRTSHRARPKARLQSLEERAKRPGASRSEKHEAQKALLAEAGFL